MATRTRSVSASRTRPPSRPPTARTDPSRPTAAPRPALPVTRLATAPCAAPLPALRRPWAPALTRLSEALPRPAAPARFRIPVAVVVPSTGVRVLDPDDDRRAAEIVVATAVSALTVLLTVASEATLLPGTAAVGGVALGFLVLTGAFSGYAAWRWLRWARHRTQRLHWSVIAAAGATITASELYGAAGIAVARSGFFERLTALAGFGFAAALTVAITGVAALITYHRSGTDDQLSRWARRFG